MSSVEYPRILHNVFWVLFLWWHSKSTWSSTFLLQVWHLNLLEPVRWVSSSLLTAGEVNCCPFLVECSNVSAELPTPPLHHFWVHVSKPILCWVQPRYCHHAATSSVSRRIHCCFPLHLCNLYFWVESVYEAYNNEHDPVQGPSLNAMKRVTDIVPRSYQNLPIPLMLRDSPCRINSSCCLVDQNTL